MTTLTLVPSSRIATEDPRKPSLLARVVEQVRRHRWPDEKSVEPILARAIDQAFESFAREARG
jgi:hypothetical protein